MWKSLIRLSRLCARSNAVPSQTYAGKRCIATSAALRGSKYYYRAIATEHPKINVIGGDLMLGFMWYWILYHLWYEPEHLLGEGYPDIAKWTDAELGIPPDDEQ